LFYHAKNKISATRFERRFVPRARGFLATWANPDFFVAANTQYSAMNSIAA